MRTQFYHIVVLSFILFCTKNWAQHQSKIVASLNTETKTVIVLQDIFFFNQTNDTISTIILNDWNHAYSDENSLLGERFADEFQRGFLLSDSSEKGFTNNIRIVNEDITPIKWCRLENKNDLIELSLDQKLAPNQKIKLYLSYEIKLPSDRFTGVGYAEKGSFHLRDCFLAPARYETQFTKNSNAALFDITNALTNYELEITTPSKFDIATDLNFTKEINRTRFFSGQNRTNFELYIEPKSSFISFKNTDIEVANNLSDTKLNDIQKAIIINRIVDFTSESLGNYPYSKILISQADYNQNPFYGLNQLPSFLSPFSSEFLYELKFLKTYLNNFLRNSMQLNQRDENWIFDGFQMYLMIKYMNQYHPESKMMGSLSKYKILKSFNLINLDFNQQYSYYYTLMARKNLDQSLSESKEKLIRFNEKIASKYKSGLCFMYLDAYLDNNIVPQTIKDFYKISTQKQASSADFEVFLKSKVTKNIDWFFDKLIKTREQADFKFGKIQKINNASFITIKNKSGLLFPVPVFGLKNNKIVTKQWLEPFKKDTLFAFETTNIDKIVLNYNNELPEFNQRNNFKNLNNFWGNNRPYKFVFMKDLEDSRYNQILYVPSIDFNIYDGLLPGLRLHNKTILDKPFIFDINPMYATKTKTLSGVFSVGINQNFRNSNLYNIRYFTNGYYFHYAPDATYLKINPTIVATIRNPDLRDNHKQIIAFRYNIIKNETSNIANNIPKENYSIANIKYYNTKQTISNLLTYIADTRFTDKFSTLSAEIQYRKLFATNRQFNIRLYAARFLHNKTTNDQYSFGVSRINDYLYEYTLLGRSENSGFVSQEYNIGDGGFKSKFDDKFANSWLATTNASYTIWNWVEAYGDLGVIKNKQKNEKFIYDNGIRLNFVPDYLELYFPIYSNNGWEVAQPNYGQKIRFVLSFSPRTLLNLFTRKWF